MLERHEDQRQHAEEHSPYDDALQQRLPKLMPASANACTPKYARATR